MSLPDAAHFDAMPAEERFQALGGMLYPGIATLVGDAVAGKITGMLLEMPTEDILKMFSSPEVLKEQVSAAIDALPADMLELLGESTAPVSDQAAMSPEPKVSPSSVMAYGHDWANCDEDEDEEMPSVQELFAAQAAKRAAKVSGSVPMAEPVGFIAPMDEEMDGFVCSWDLAQWAEEPADKLAAFIAERLEEPQVRIPRAVVEILGAPVALALLHRTERCIHNGGMIVEETGKPRTMGGIFLKLLKDATDLDVDAQGLAVLRIKKEGDDAKKAQRKALTAKRSAVAGKPTAVNSPSTAQKPEGRAKPTFADFMVQPQIRA